MSTYIFDPSNFDSIEFNNLKQKPKTTRPSPRRNVFKISQPPLPKHYISKAIENKGYGNVQYESSLKSAVVVQAHDFTKSIREEILAIDRSTDENLKEAYRVEQEHYRHHQQLQENSTSSIGKLGTSFFRYQQQIGVLDESMRRLCQATRPYSIDQANLMWKIWSSAGDLYSSVFQSMSQAIDELTLKLSEKTLAAKNWENKFVVLHGKFARLSASNTTTKDTELQSTVRQYEEELMLKDKEILSMQTMITNVTIWFPNFVSFGNSILRRFLPPISNEQMETNQQQLFAVPKNDIDGQVKLAKDFLVEDLKRIEELNLGFEIVLPTLTKATSEVAAGTSYKTNLLHSTGSSTVDSGVASASASAPPVGALESMNKRTQSRKFSNLSSNGAPREDLKSLNKGLFLNSAPSASFSAATETEYNLRNVARTDSADYVESISNLANQIQRQQSQHLSQGRRFSKKVSLEMEPEEKFDTIEDGYSAFADQSIVRMNDELKQKLKIVLHEAQVLESQNQLLASTTKRQIVGLENDLKLANKREKQLIAQLKKAQNESSSILTCLPSAFFIPKTSHSYASPFISRFLLPVYTPSRSNLPLLRDSPELPLKGKEGDLSLFSFDLDELIGPRQSFISISETIEKKQDELGLLSLQELENRISEMLNQFLGFADENQQLDLLPSNPPSSSATALSNLSIMIESNQWSLTGLTNLLSGQAKHFFTYPPMNLELSYSLDDESFERYELQLEKEDEEDEEELVRLKQMNQSDEKRLQKETLPPPPQKKFTKILSSVFFHQIFHYHCNRFENKKIAMIETRKLFSSFLFWGFYDEQQQSLKLRNDRDEKKQRNIEIEAMNEQQRYESEYHAGWLRLIGRLLFGKYYLTLIDFLEKITDQTDLSLMKDASSSLYIPSAELSTETLSYRKKDEQTLKKEKKYRKYYEQNEFQQKMNLDVCFRFYLSFKDYFLSSELDFPVSFLEKGLSRIFFIFQDDSSPEERAVVSAASRALPATTENTRMKTPKERNISSALGSDRLALTGTVGVSGLSKVLKVRCDPFNIQDQLLYNGRFEIALFWHTLPYCYYRELFDSLVISSKFPASDSPLGVSVPVINLFSALDGVMQAVSTIEKLLLVILEELYVFLLSLFPEGPCDALFGEALHLILQLSPMDCLREFRYFQPQQSGTSNNIEEVNPASSRSFTQNDVGSVTGVPAAMLEQEGEMSGEGMISKRIPLNIDLMDSLQLLQCSGQLTGPLFARVVLESSPPLLMKNFHVLLSFLHSNSYHLLHYPAAAAAVPSSSYSSSAPRDRRSARNHPSFYSELGQIGNQFYFSFQKLFKASRPSTREQSTVSTTARPGDEVEPSYFRENMEIYRKIVEEVNEGKLTDNNKNHSSSTKQADSKHVMNLLYYYAFLCFDPHQREILPIKITIQWFTVIMLRYSLGDLIYELDETVENRNVHEDSSTVDEMDNSLDDAKFRSVHDEIDFQAKKLHGKVKRYSEMLLLKKAFRAIARAAEI